EIRLALREFSLLLGFLLRPRLQLGFALRFVFGCLLGARSGVGLGSRLGLGFGFRFRLGTLGFALLVLGLFARHLGGGFLPRLLGFEAGFLRLELHLGVGFAPRGFFLLLLLLLFRLGARLLERHAAQLRDLALGERGVDAGRELLDVELEVVRVVAVLDRAPE